jgi:ABC-2 type transport system ATP-binding protein
MGQARSVSAVDTSVKQVISIGGQLSAATISCIIGVSSPTEGTIVVFGNDVVKDYREARACIGVSPQEFTIDTFQTVDEILDYQAGFFGITGARMKKRREEMLNQFDLVEHRDKKFQFLSGGLKRRVMIALVIGSISVEGFAYKIVIYF